MIENHLGIIIGTFWNVSYCKQQSFSLIQRLYWTNMDSAYNIHGSKEAIRLPHICTNYLFIMVVYCQRITIITLFFQIPNFNCLVCGTWYELCIVKYDCTYEIIVSVKLIDARSCLKTKYIYAEVFSSKSKAFLAWKLAGHWDSVWAYKKWFSARAKIFLKIYFIHFNEAITCSSYKLHYFIIYTFFYIGLINKNYMRYFFLLY